MGGTEYCWQFENLRSLLSKRTHARSHSVVVAATVDVCAELEPPAPPTLLPLGTWREGKEAAPSQDESL